MSLKVYDGAEIFSGVATLSDCLREEGFDVASMDIINWEKFASERAKGGKPLKCRNALDLTTSAGFGQLSKDSLVDPA